MIIAKWCFVCITVVLFAIKETIFGKYSNEVGSSNLKIIYILGNHGPLQLQPTNSNFRMTLC